jgi:hypothetical protein
MCLHSILQPQGRKGTGGTGLAGARCWASAQVPGSRGQGQERTRVWGLGAPCGLRCSEQALAMVASTQQLAMAGLSESEIDEGRG